MKVKSFWEKVFQQILEQHVKRLSLQDGSAKFVTQVLLFFKLDVTAFVGTL